VIEPAPHQIIVGVHRSAASLAALRWAAAEARLRRAELHVVHAWEPAVRRASYAILGDSRVSGQERLRAQGVLAAVMRGVYGSKLPAVPRGDPAGARGGHRAPGRAPGRPGHPCLHAQRPVPAGDHHG